MKVAIVAGEKSGDFLGAELIKEMRSQFPDAEFIGLCGPLMLEQGAISLDDMEKISIFGLDGLFSSLREILAIRKKLFQHFKNWRPDVFIGIDVPDFNLGLERKLKALDIPIAHYVSPTVWAWRGGRIKKIRSSIDLMLTLFPFEKTYYQKNNTPVEYVGHPLAKQITNWCVDAAVIKQLSLDSDSRVIGVLPGSRMSEVTRLAPVMLEGITELSKRFTGLKFVIPAANSKIYNYLIQLPNYDSSIVEVINGHSRDVMSLSHMLILASGTAALEAALFAKPMIVMYKVSKLSAFVYKNSITVQHYSMPNHLTEAPMVPELIQHNATAENLVAEVSKLLDNKELYASIKVELNKIAPMLATNSGELACQAIKTLLVDKSKI